MKGNASLRDGIYGIPLPAYLALFGLVCLAMYFGLLPDNMLGALTVLVVFGGLFYRLGEVIPVIRSYLGGGTIFCIFGASFLSWLHLIPETVEETVSTFLNGTGFLDFFISALIVGSILSMDRELLLKSALRFLPVAFCSMLLGIVSVALIGKLLGYSFEDTVMYIAIPMMSGGMGAGVIPLAGMYAEALHVESAAVISRLIPASAVGNVAAILTAGLLARLGERAPQLTGNGRLMRGSGNEENEEKKRPPVRIDMLVTGFVVSLAFYLGGRYLNRLIPAVHAYAWMILLTAGARASGRVPDRIAESARQWSSLLLAGCTHAVLIGIGIAMIDLDAVTAVLSPSWLLLVIVITAAVTAGAAIGGYLVGFYPIESGITAGLCTINMGGSGNIAILSASRRMELLPFAQLATRICGSLTLVAASLLIRIFFG